MQEISTISADFKTKKQEFVEVIQGQLSWMEANATFSKHFPQKTTENFNIVSELMDFSNKAVARLSATVRKKLERCVDFYKRMIKTHNICQPSTEK